MSTATENDMAHWPTGEQQLQFCWNDLNHKILTTKFMLETLLIHMGEMWIIENYINRIDILNKILDKKS